jgi:PAS domain S-box-containing protein
MHPKSILSNLRISTKLLLLNLMICAGFLLIVCVIVFSFANVRNSLTQVTDWNMGTVIDNSRTARELSTVFSDIDLMSRTFYGRSDYLDSEGRRLFRTVKNIAGKNTDSELYKSLLTLSDDLDSFLSQCAVVNTVLHARDSIDRETHAYLTSLENMIGKLLVKFTLQGEDTSFVEQQLTLVIGYRESLLQIGKLYAELGAEHYFTDLEAKTSPVVAAIDDLILRLRTITASVPDVARYGVILLSNVQKYKEIVFRFYAVMQELGLRVTKLNLSKASSMLEMESIDKKISRTTQLVSSSIEKIIFTSGIIVLGLSILVIATLGFATAYLIRSNINNPMKAILKGIESFRQGSFDTPIELSRQDEWDTIVKALNNMAADLLESYTALQENEKKYRSLFESSRDAIAIVSQDGKFIDVNQSYLDLVGYDWQDLLNMNAEKLWADPAERLKWQQIIEKSGSVVDYEHRIRRKDGVERDCLLTSTVRRMEDDSIQYQSIARDITERKRAEEKLIRYRDHLAELVTERTRKLEKAQGNLIRQERLAALGKLTATVSHEIRNPLGTINTSVFAIGDALERNQMERVERALKLTERNIRRCDKIITELLDFTRKRELNPEPLVIDSWLGTLLDEQQYPEGIASKCDFHTGICLPIDREYMRRAITNVITNAVQAMEDEESQGRELKVESAVAGDRLEIRIIDNGIGISADILEEVFEPLFSTKSFGVGLGLPIVKDIMEAHGGGIAIKSNRGRQGSQELPGSGEEPATGGTTVVLWLPISATEQVQSEGT